MRFRGHRLGGPGFGGRLFGLIGSGRVRAGLMDGNGLCEHGRQAPAEAFFAWGGLRQGGLSLVMFRDGSLVMPCCVDRRAVRGIGAPLSPSSPLRRRLLRVPSRPLRPHRSSASAQSTALAATVPRETSLPTD